MTSEDYAIRPSNLIVMALALFSMQPMEKIHLWHVSSFINGLKPNLANIFLQAISVIPLKMKWPDLQKAQLWPLLYFQSTKAYGENMFALGFIIYQWIKTKFSRYLPLVIDILSYEYEVATLLNKGHNSGSLQYFKELIFMENC